MSNTLDRTFDAQLTTLRNEIDRRVEVLQNEISNRPKAGREVALVITKLQEARLWAGEALKERGYYETQTSK